MGFAPNLESVKLFSRVHRATNTATVAAPNDGARLMSQAQIAPNSSPTAIGLSEGSIPTAKWVLVFCRKFPGWCGTRTQRTARRL